MIVIAAGVSNRLSELTREIPKSFLIIKGKRLIEYHLDILNDKGFKQVTLVVGYLKECFLETIGTKYKNLKIDYVISKDYATTGHCWSIYSARSLWEKNKKPVVLIHADIFYNPSILDRVMASKYEDVLGVDENYIIQTQDEAVVQGKNDVVQGIVIVKSAEKGSTMVGESVGINKWSAKFMKQFYQYIENFFNQNGRNYNWEPVVTEFIKDQDVLVHYEKCGDFSWININYKEDYDVAQNVIYHSIYQKG